MANDLVTIQQRLEQKARSDTASKLSYVLDVLSNFVNDVAYPSKGYGYCRPLTLKISGQTILIGMSDLRYALSNAIMSAFDKDITAKATDDFMAKVNALAKDVDKLTETLAPG